MAFSVILTESFKRTAKKLAKKHPSLGSDIKGLIEELEVDPYKGIRLSSKVFKIRISIKSKGKGAQFIPVPLQKAHLIRFCMTTSQRLDSTAPRKKYNFSTVAISQNVEVFL